MASFKVTGPAPIVGSDGKPVETGGTVDLDEDTVNVEALIRSGAVTAKRPKPTTDTGSRGGD